MTRCCNTCCQLGWEHINLTSDYLWRSNDQGRYWKVLAATAAAKALTCFKFRFLKRPLHQRSTREISGL